MNDVETSAETADEPTNDHRYLLAAEHSLRRRLTILRGWLSLASVDETTIGPDTAKKLLAEADGLLQDVETVIRTVRAVTTTNAEIHRLLRLQRAQR